MATSTGHVLYLAATSGIYAFSIMSDGTLSPLSQTPQLTGSYNQIAVTPGIPTGQSAPLLLGVTTSSTSIASWPLNPGGSVNTGGSASIPVSQCTSPKAYSGTVTSLTVTPDSQYVIPVDGTYNSNILNNIASISLSSGNTCNTATSTGLAPGNYPVQPAIDCAVSGSSPCILFLTLSSTQIGNTNTPAIPVEASLTPSSGTLGSAVSPAYTCSPTSSCPLGAAFNPTTVFFYATFAGTTPPSLQSIAPQTAAATGSSSFSSSAPVNYPCVDTLAGVAYVPSANGYLYSVSTAAGGGLGGVTTLLSPGSLGTTLIMTSCAVSTNP